MAQGQITPFMYFSYNSANNGIGDEGISHLVDCKWPEVDFIHLSTNPFGDDGVKYLLEHPWPNLKKIKMKRTKKIS